MFFREKSDFESYENIYNNDYGDKIISQVECKDIPVYSFRMRESFNKHEEKLFK